ncbi:MULTISPECIES: GNAT family N-acetyltransferase [unclassified Streptomyces]|uniref:GNAT family N-acetyltransferase n=1 Tax=unclassified Streptomyces TaxID=2593676 RepID=UPI00136E4946|nr:GNAT family N-acetyltransferase [Streptomyces sp. SolWspMP-5a-2]MYQ64554.1 GNAT family N-acetyltransferase [Streptomyces sp. SID4950]
MHIARLDDPRSSAFLAFARRATLDSLTALRSHRHTAPGQSCLCAWYRGEVIGCTSWLPRRRLRYANLEGAQSHLTAVHLCSSEVLPEFRGLGVGSLLYERRLVECGGADQPVSVEILGRGRPLSVAAGALPGLVWHLARGFLIVGHSVDEDAGPVLARKAPAATATLPRTASPATSSERI